MPRSFIEPYSDFISREFQDGEIVAFGCCRGEAVLVAGVTNKGKSTLMRVISLCAASGRDFSPFVSASSEGLRVVLLDYEGSAGRTQADLRLMEQNLTENERELLRKNFFVSHSPRLSEDESLTLSIPTHMAQLRNQARGLSPDIVMVDTMSAAFAMKSENDNAEINKLIMKPIIEQLARPLNCVVGVVGHIGKASREEGATREPAHKMRGGSAYGDRATVIFNVEGHPDSKDRIRVICAKEKTGNDFEITLELNRETRWLSIVEDRVRAKAPTAEDKVLAFLVRSSVALKTGAIVTGLADEISESAVKHALTSLANKGQVSQPKRGYWKAVEPEIIVED
jgi:hypothetical protein